MSVYTGASRGELIAWLNDLLAPQVVQKVEECGKGVILCQVLDSIYGDLPMSRVKFNARMEYEYLENFKILQKAFAKHKIDKPIPVGKLVKCKMQDNLEFLQWMKKFWDANSTGAAYDTAGRGMIASSGSSAPAPRTSTSARAPAPAPRSSVAAAAGARAPSAASAAQLSQLNAQVLEMQAQCEGLEKERDFYFAKLRSIELIVGDRINFEHIDPEERDTLAKIQEVLYQTEDGFEVPNEEFEGELDDEETF
ncbi:hypothetical protein CC85DRAFT_288875 [Cutaneotrichosporon oleaginosum]|uniref:Microtubule binding protein n=1 Tax=Cutaneotrichosporon oleaginosum TaxID=879819 RepID=A0A0J0XDE6_9TREE|nr:uncharacterized protein CC85DRAFT_288875 [Cutaneotrichosporon oleaginosum]KLT39101.1 hypothetical protein CC85DRAFT_288875 [Cutaneotrichosporon oleaginosum]